MPALAPVELGREAWRIREIEESQVLDRLAWKACHDSPSHDCPA
jgi:hypothetical protein